ncbi:MAG: sigma-54-dependent Fis family transcriptional regulator [Candidatus Rokubacteria bacterium]|nr:sigma-54-dependent Fis family transcriptional regulator [Candidatus Rokubacteria bacterium]
MIVLDETLEISESARRVGAAAEVQLRFAGSTTELGVVLAGPRPDDLLVANLTPGLSPWELAGVIRRAGFNGQLLALVDDLGDPGLEYLAGIPGTRCVARPSAAVLERVLHEMLGARADSPGTPRFAGVVGRSPALREIFALIEKVAAGDANVLVIGESGTGKELIARAIHALGARKEGPFVPLDCTAIPEGLVESQLFGHVKGAFTGAAYDREGVFSLADTGTLFIDELCELGIPMQAKLLRIIQTREFVKLGGTKSTRTDVRLVMATNKDPRDEVAKGRFREDLYYRVAVVTINVPPLRERRDDIPLLAEHFVARFSKLHKKPIRGLDPRAMARLCAAPWPGNVRQLENVIEQAVVLADTETLTERDLFREIRHAIRGVPDEIEAALPLREVERRHILRMLEATGGSRTEAARRLGISVRCLQYKLKSYLEHPKRRLIAT